MAYEESSTLSSKAAYKVLRTLYLCEAEEGMYAKEIAEESDQSRHTVSKYLKALRDLNLIKRSKRTKAQYYVFDLKGFYNYFWEYWNDLMTQKVENIDRDETIHTNLVSEEMIEKEDIRKNTERYIETYLESFEQSSLEEMIFEQFGMACVLTIIEMKENEIDIENDFLQLMNNVIMFYVNKNSKGIRVFEDVFFDQ